MSSSANTYENDLRAQLVLRAKSLLAGEVQFIEGVRQVQALRFRVTGDDYDPDFFVFVAVDSDSDDIPSPELRTHCSPSWLATCDEKALEIEKMYRFDVMQACEKLIQRFSTQA